MESKQESRLLATGQALESGKRLDTRVENSTAVKQDTAYRHVAREFTLLLATGRHNKQDDEWGRGQSKPQPVGRYD
jgi:hypothetical protein